MSLSLARFAATWLLVACAVSGCVTVISPPQGTTDPVEVYVVDHGRTSSLVVPSEHGMLRYAYGDWAYYALGQKDLFHGIAALLWPTRSGLGRAELVGTASAETVSTSVPSIQSLHRVRVERARLRAFEQSMEALYAAGREREVENSLAGLTFVPHPRPYTYFWNSNHAVAGWLRELGCLTRGASFLANWRVAAESESRK